MAKQNLEKYIEDATKNIIEDRAATKTLLMTMTRLSYLDQEAMFLEMKMSIQYVSIQYLILSIMQLCAD